MVTYPFDSKLPRPPLDSTPQNICKEEFCVGPLYVFRWWSSSKDKEDNGQKLPLENVATEANKMLTQNRLDFQICGYFTLRSHRIVAMNKFLTSALRSGTLKKEKTAAFRC